MPSNMIISVTISLLLFHFGVSLKPDKFFKLCARSDPKLNECIKDSMHNMKPLLKKGIPQLQIAPLDPMVVPRVSLTQGSGPVSIDSTFTDLKIRGMTAYNMQKVEANLDEYKINFEATLPYFFNEGGYEIKGRVLVLPITGQGTSWSNYTGVLVKASLDGSPRMINGKKHMQVDDFKFDLEVKNAIIHMDNLFNGNKELGDAMNQFMSENWEAVFKELKPVVNEAVSALLKDVAVKVFNKFPLDQLFPE